MCDVEIPGMGRGVIALRPIRKNEIVLDYHGLETEGERLDEYCEKDPTARLSEYIVDVRQGRQRLIDASIDPCAVHFAHRCLGRLVNYAAESQKGRFNEKCNLKLAEVVCSQLTNQRIVVLVARRDIEPLEQLLWDYKDDVARKSFQS